MSNSARLIILLFALGLIACETKELNLAGNEDQMIGSWFNPQYTDSIVRYERSEGLVSNEYSFSFNEDHTFIERKNAGWCGTPPISYADFEGTWTLNDSVIEISVGFWGGTADYQWKILSLNNEVLKIKREEEIYHHEEAFW
jgi:hypothetical protein